METVPELKPVPVPQVIEVETAHWYIIIEVVCDYHSQTAHLRAIVQEMVTVPHHYNAHATQVGVELIALEYFAYLSQFSWHLV